MCGLQPHNACHHVHEANEWAHAIRPDGTRHFHTKDGREFTADLAYHVALSLTFWAARTGRIVVAVPKLFIRPVETGSRKGWTEVPPHFFRETAMLGVALRLGLSHPFVTMEGKPRLLCADDVQSDSKGYMYIGTGNARLRLSRSPMAPDYEIGRDGAAEHCLLHYAVRATAGGVDGMVAALRACPPAVYALVCECKRGEPCGGEGLCNML